MSRYEELLKAMCEEDEARERYYELRDAKSDGCCHGKSIREVNAYDAKILAAAARLQRAVDKTLVIERMLTMPTNEQIKEMADQLRGAVDLYGIQDRLYTVVYDAADSVIEQLEIKEADCSLVAYAIWQLLDEEFTAHKED